MQKEVSKIQKEVIENFEDHYKKNAIQPTITLNYYGDIISYIYSENVYTTKLNKTAQRNGMVYMDKCKQIRHDYVFYDEEKEEIIQTFISCSKHPFTNRTLVTKLT